MQASFSFTAMPRLLFGPGQIRALGSHVAGFGRSVLLVTGANSGIGEAVALALGAAGANVVVNYLRGTPAAERVAEFKNKLESRIEKAHLIVNRVPGELPVVLREHNFETTIHRRFAAQFDNWWSVGAALVAAHPGGDKPRPYGIR